MNWKVPALACAATILAATAHATVVTGTDIAISNTPGATFSASPGAFSLKTQPCCGAFTGVGVSGGRTEGEIDIDESITGVFDIPTILDVIQLMLLYDGPEFHDVEEVAQVTASPSGGGPALVGTLRTEYQSDTDGVTAYWSVNGGLEILVANLSPAVDSNYDTSGAQGAAVWRVVNPFGSTLLEEVSFTAVSGTCGSGKCRNQSDYSIESLEYTAVPEPGTLALIGGGLAGLALRRRRRIGPRA